MVRELFRAQHISHQGGQSHHGNILSNHGDYNAMVSSTTGLIVNGITDGGGHYGYGDQHNLSGCDFQKSAMDDYHEHWPLRSE